MYNEVDGGMVFHKSAGQSERDVVGVLVFVQVLFAVMPYGPGVGATVSAYQVKNSPFEPVVYKLYGFVFGAKKRLFPFFQYHRYQVVAVQIESPVIVETPLIQFFKVLQMGGGVELVPAQHVTLAGQDVPVEPMSTSPSTTLTSLPATGGDISLAHYAGAAIVLGSLAMLVARPLRKLRSK